MKRAILIVPHEDDELLIGGSALIELIRSSEWDVTVLYITTGDARGKWEGIIRMRDSKKVLTFLGLNPSNIIYLGYANRWQNDKHIYNEKSGKILVSRAGETQTYGPREDSDYSYIRTQRHNPYTRENIVNDLGQIFKDIMPDLYIVVDMDSHEDHKATSLFVDECLCSLLKENREYHPLILKRFAYVGSWQGRADYWDIPHAETKIEGELPNPFFDLNEIIRFSVPKDCNTLLLKHNTLYKAAKKYSTQYVWTRAACFANDDICFFRRHTENQVLYAYIETSSGNAEYLNDFKLLDSNKLDDSEVICCDAGIWRPENEDLKKEICITFQEFIPIRLINIYEYSSGESKINKINLFFDNGKKMSANLQSRRKNSIHFNNSELPSVKRIKIVIEGYTGQDIGISEIEVFSHVIPLDEYELPFCRYEHSQDIDISEKMSKRMLFEKTFFFRTEYLRREIFIPTHEMKVHYPILLRNKLLLPLIYFVHVLRQILHQLKVLLSC